MRNRGVDLSTVGVVDTEGDANTLEQDLEEDLGVEGERGGVEGNCLVSWDECVRTSNGVRCEQVDELSGCEATVCHTGEDNVDIALRQRDGVVTGGEGSVRATSQELQLGCTRAVRAIMLSCQSRNLWKCSIDVHAKCTGELDQVTSGNKVTSEEWRKGIDGVINTGVGGEVGLDFGEQDHGAISTSAVEGTRDGETDGIMEGQTERLVGVFTTLAFEQVGLQVVHQWEEDTALLRDVISIYQPSKVYEEID